MPKQGQRQPYRVVFQYPAQGKPFRFPHSTLYAAEKAAGEIGQRGGTAQLIEIDLDAPGAPERVIAKFGPHEVHLYELLNNRLPDSGLVCRCGRRPEGDEEARTHMELAGVCYVCQGTTMVAQRATRDGGVPMAGNLMDCPICGGSGSAADMSFGDVDLDAFYDRQTMARLRAQALARES